MTRIITSALRPMRLHGAQHFQTINNTQLQSLRVARRAATTYSSGSSTAPAPQRTPPLRPQPSSYKRSANTTTSSTPSSSSSTQDAAPAKPTTSAYAENQVNPVHAAPYTPPANAGGPIPEAGSSSSSSSPETSSSNFANNGIDWSSSFHGLSTTPFSPEVAAVLMRPIPFEDVEIKPDGIIYLPEIKYRRILNQAFGPGGWGMAPRGDLAVGEKVVTREYALLVHGR